MSHWGLRKKGIEPLYPDEWNTVLDALDQLYGNFGSSVKYSDLAALGYDIIPDADARRSLGSASKAWLALYGYYGYFNSQVYVQGKPVLKDGDPITVIDLGDAAVADITTAVNRSVVAAYTGNIWDKFAKIAIDQYGRVGVVISDGATGGGGGAVTVTDLSDTAVADVTAAIDRSAVARAVDAAGRIRASLSDVAVAGILDEKAMVRTGTVAKWLRVDVEVGRTVMHAAQPLNAGFPDPADYMYVGPSEVAAFKNLTVDTELRVDGKVIAKALQVGGKIINNNVIEIDA